MPMIQIHLAAGRTDQEKRALLAAVNDAAVNSLGVQPSSVRVWIDEIIPTEMMVGGTMLADIRSQTTPPT